jgi:hypothetical protein
MTENVRENVLKEARRIEEDNLYSAKGQFVMANFWSRFHLWIGVPTAILAAIASASALSQFDNHNLIAGILAIVVTGLTAVTTFVNPNEKASAHRNSGNKYNSLRNRARIFREVDSQTAKSEQVLTDRLKQLAGERDELNQSSPPVFRWAYIRAKKGIQEGEADYEADEHSAQPQRLNRQNP